MLVRLATTCTFVLGGSVAGVTCTVRRTLLAGSSEFGDALPNADGWLGSPPHVLTGDALLRGMGPAMMKSLRLLLVSTQPLFLRMAAVVLESAAVGNVREQFAPPYPTRSTIVASVGHAPLKGVVLATRAILPAVPLRFDTV